ncbi:response regulator transcription factor [Paenarthrobacter ilicis]|uniref:response regulator transcription factor n=1 Tax=Paenarthrobacter ilicis TaxID=43665 RepID=UPI0028D346FA|nr:response regulator transcription factor [Paenarthrobacter ilicis]
MEASAKATPPGTRTAVIIEDEADIRAALEGILTSAGFTVHAFERGMEGVEGVRAQQPDIVTLDLSLGDIDGFEVARQVRQFSDAYIVILSARTQELDTLLGLEAGADDYVTKPFRPRELRYRVEALLRRPRTRSTPNATESAPPGIPARRSAPEAAEESVPLAAAPDAPTGLEHNGLHLNAETRTVELSGTELRLTRSEFDLLFALMKNGRTVLTKDELSRSLHSDQAPDGYWSDADGRAIHVHITNLRRKLGDAAANPRWVETVRGVGYRLAGRSH